MKWSILLAAVMLIAVPSLMTTLNPAVHIPYIGPLAMVGGVIACFWAGIIFAPMVSRLFRKN
jgi:hypothetical protein